ncbi:hypothetical protein HUU53_02285 [Candidatus Micrarchaeota archaeon]|nr:hypothetical protein [Candidatus Micrarchaeota archaeon]
MIEELTHEEKMHLGKLFFTNLPRNAVSRVLHQPDMIKLASPKNEQAFRALNKALELGVVFFRRKIR